MTEAPNPTPRWGTPARADRPNRAQAIAEVASDLDIELMPWQRDVAAIATELTNDGAPAYDVVICLAPVGSGKTTIGLIAAIERLRDERGAIGGLCSGASHNTAARALIESCSILGAGDLSDARLYPTNGKEALKFGNDATLEPQDGKSVGPAHVITLLDDAHKLEESPLAGLSHSLADAGQLWVFLEVGHLRLAQSLINMGRKAVEADAGTGVAYFEWSVSADDDLDDPAVWHKCMPALGHLTTVADVARRLRRANDFDEVDAFDAAFGGRLNDDELVQQ